MNRPTTVEELRSARTARYNVLRRYDRRTLYDMASCLRRVHSFTSTTPKIDLIYAIIDVELPVPRRWEKEF